MTADGLCTGGTDGVKQGTERSGTFVYPFARLKPRPSPADRIRTIHVDRELGSEAVTYTLASGREGTVHIEQILDYNKDPDHVLSRREIIRRLGTSPAQFYRLLDQTNYDKSVDRLVALLQALDCEVALTVRAPPA